MEKNKEKTRGKISIMVETFNVNKRNIIEPIEWKPYDGEEIIVNTIIRNSKRVYEKEFFEDKVKAVPRGNAYCIGNGQSGTSDHTLCSISGSKQETCKRHDTSYSKQPTLDLRQPSVLDSRSAWPQEHISHRV